MTLTLYSAWRATAPYRVRIGLKLKGLDYDYVGVDLLAGEQHKPAYRAVNRQRLTLLEYLDEVHPEPALLPGDARARARIRAMALIIACDIHPLNNTRVARALEAMDVSPVRRAKWTERWIVDGLQTLEPMIAEFGKGFAFGDTPTLADCCLIPQVYSANRFGVSLEPFPAIQAVAERAANHPAFMAAHPDLQPDAVNA